MSGPGTPIAEEELHAYVDNRLDPARRHAVQRYLEANPEARRRVLAWVSQNEALRVRFASVLAEPLPPSLNLSRLIEERLRSRRAIWRTAAAAAIALLAGGGAGWFMHGNSRIATATALLEQQAIATHVVYSADRRHPIEVTAAERDHLAQWLSNRLQRKVQPPDLDALGYQLIGGRLLATEHGGAAALFMYENAGHQRLSVVMRPMSRDLRAQREVIAQKSAVNGCAWIAGGMGYAVVGNLPESDLDRAAQRISSEGTAG